MKWYIRGMFQRLWIIALLACSGGTAVPVVPNVPVGDHGVDIANLNAQLPPYLASIGEGEPLQALSGYVLVVQHDQVVFGRGFGFANRDKRLVPTPDTSFRIGSVTKQFTAAAILRLEQDGKLSVQDTVSKHLPDYRGPAKDVTIHQLLTHTAGIPNYTADRILMEKRAQPITVHDLIAAFSELPLEFSPGSKFRYSNSGYVVLGAIIEHASGMSYKRYLETKLFAAAKLQHTEVGDAAGVTDRAEGYEMAGDKLVPAHPIDMSFPFSAGSVRSTANDMVRWHRALAGDAILSAAQRDKLYHPDHEHYGYGWSVTEVKGHAVVGHNGGIDGFGAIYLRVPDADLVVIAWSNVEGVEIDPAGKATLDAALGGKLEPFAPMKRGTVDPAMIERVVGKYTISDESKAQLVALGAGPELIEGIKSIDISAAPKGIRLKPAGQSAIDMPPTEDGSFYDTANKVRLRFELPESGPAKAVVLEQSKLKITYQR
jgi:CubicO group peptidase (beta-lactamase class C family)